MQTWILLRVACYFFSRPENPIDDIAHIILPSSRYWSLFEHRGSETRKSAGAPWSLLWSTVCPSPSWLSTITPSSASRTLDRWCLMSIIFTQKSLGSSVTSLTGVVHGHITSHLSHLRCRFERITPFYRCHTQDETNLDLSVGLRNIVMSVAQVRIVRPCLPCPYVRSAVRPAD